MKIACVVCGKEFYAYPSDVSKRGKRYCSQDCYFTDQIERIRALGRANKGKPCSEKAKEINGERLRHQAPEIRRKAELASSRRMLELWKDPIFRKTQVERLAKENKEQRDEIAAKVSATRKERFANDPEWKSREIKRLVSSHHKRPTSLERIIIGIIDSNNLPYKYVGDGHVIINGRCPDFINIDGKKQVIEVFGNYWHDIFDVGRKVEHYRKYGFKTLVIWEEELKNHEKVLAKIKSFSRQRGH